MNINHLKIGKGRSLFNLFIRFNKTQKIFPSVTRVLSILLTTAAMKSGVERANSKKRVA